MEQNLQNLDDEKMRGYGKIFRVRITSTSVERVLRYVAARLIDKTKFYIVTPNPEIALKAKRDVVLNKVIERSDFSIPDGVGLAWAAKFMDGAVLEIIPGRVLFTEIIKLANKKGLRVVFYGSRGEVVYKAKEKILQNYKNLTILALPAPEYDSHGIPSTPQDRLKHKSCMGKIKLFEPDLIFVGMTTPKQEKWLSKNFFILPGVGAMTVGGTFDYLSGIMKLPPTWMQGLGLEWLYRLIQDPKRYKRIVNAVVVFPIEIIKYKYFRKIKK